MLFVRTIFLLFVIVCLAYAAPAEEEVTKEVAKIEKKKDTADERAVSVAEDQNMGDLADSK